MEFRTLYIINLMFKLLCLCVLVFFAASFTMEAHRSFADLIAVKDADCPHDREVACIDDINKGNFTLNQLTLSA